MIKNISAQELAQLVQSNKANELFILDVRNDDELAVAKLNYSHHHIPMPDILDRISEIPKDMPIICICHHGMRSAKVAHTLINKGFFEVYSLDGGIHAISSIDSTIPKY